MTLREKKQAAEEQKRALLEARRAAKVQRTQKILLNAIKSTFLDGKMDDESISDMTQECLSITVADAKTHIKNKQFLKHLYKALNPHMPPVFALSKSEFV